MPNTYFRFKQFTINQAHSVFKVGTDGVLLGAAASLEGGKKILDIGTGTGLIAIMAAQRSDGEITAIEPDEGSFVDACANVADCKWNNRINVVNLSLQEMDPSYQGYFDIILSNPPWFNNALQNPDPSKAAARHTVNLSSADLLTGAGALLSQNGNMQVIMPYSEGTLFIAEASDYGLYCTALIKIKAVPASEIKRLIMRFERHKKPVSERFITIGTSIRHRYSEDYKALTRDFYLNF